MENTAFTITFEDAAKVVNRLGQYEFRLAVSRCGASATLDEIVAAVEAHRKPLMQDAGRNTGSSILMSADAWDKLAKESDAAARRELLKDSRALKSVDELVSKANIAAEAAKRAQEEFERTYRELDSIPAKIDRLSLKLSQINASRKQLADAEAKFKSLYSAILRSAQTHAGLLTDMAGMVATKPQRLEVLAEIEGETNAELSTLQARERELRKLLGIK